MIHIILLILKIIGWILLVILGILLLAVLAVLFIPVRYQGEGKKYEAVQGMGRATWLFHMLSFSAVYENGLSLSFRIFGIPIGGKKKESSGEEELEEDEFWEKISEELEEEADVHIASAEDNGPDFEYHKTEEGKAAAGQENQEEKQKSEPETEQKKGMKKGKKEKKEKKSLKETCQSFREKWNTLEEKAVKAKEFISDQENQAVFALLLRQTKALLKHIFPKKVKGTLTIGFEEPYTTGQVLAAAGFLCPLYENTLEIYPSFEEPVMEGELFVSGRLRIYSLVVIAGRLFLNKRFRYLLRKVMK